MTDMKAPDYILAFVEAVYPGNAELSLSMFNERTCLTDATKLINELRQRTGVLDRIEEPTSEVKAYFSRATDPAFREYMRLISERFDRMLEEEIESEEDRIAFETGPYDFDVHGDRGLPLWLAFRDMCSRFVKKDSKS